MDIEPVYWDWKLIMCADYMKYKRSLVICVVLRVKIAAMH